MVTFKISPIKLIFFKCVLIKSPVNSIQDFPGDSVVKNLPAKAGNARDLGLTRGLGRSPRVGNGNSLQYSCLENSIDRGAWWSTVHGVARVGHHGAQMEISHQVSYNF